MKCVKGWFRLNISFLLSIEGGDIYSLFIYSERLVSNHTKCVRKSGRHAVVFYTVMFGPSKFICSSNGLRINLVNSSFADTLQARGNSCKSLCTLFEPKKNVFCKKN